MVVFRRMLLLVLLVSYRATSVNSDFIRCPKDKVSCKNWDCSHRNLFKRARIECDEWPFYAGSWGFDWDPEV